MRATVQPWARAAQDLEEEHHRREFFDALDAAGREGEIARHLRTCYLIARIVPRCEPVPSIRCSTCVALQHFAANAIAVELRLSRLVPEGPAPRRYP